MACFFLQDVVRMREELALMQGRLPGSADEGATRLAARIQNILEELDEILGSSLPLEHVPNAMRDARMAMIDAEWMVEGVA